MQEQTKMRLAENNMLIDSIYPDVLYAIENGNKTLHIFHGQGLKHEMIIAPENVKAFAEEIVEVWEHMGGVNNG